MKKLLLVICLSCVVLFGADLQQVTPKMQEMSPASNIDFSKATELKFVEANPAQITIKVPLELDEPPVGEITSKGIIKSTSQKLVCKISNKDQPLDTGFYSSKIVKAGNSTVTIKFNGISKQKLMKINRADCWIEYFTESGYEIVYKMGLSSIMEPSSNLVSNSFFYF